MRGRLTKFAFAIALSGSATAFGATLTENFSTDPTARGWSGVNNTTPPNSYGYSAGTDNTLSSVAPPAGGGAATGAGEAGGAINRGPNSFYGVNLGGPIDLEFNNVNVKGVVILTNRGSSTTLNMGWSQGIATVNGDGSDPTNFMGMAWDDGFNGSGGMRIRNTSSVASGSGPSFPDPNSVTPVPMPFQMDWNVGTRTFTMTLGANSGQVTVPLGDLPGMPIVTHWGLWGRTGASPDNANTLFIDDVTYTAVPEPASLGLLSLGGLALARRRRQ